MSTRKIDSGVSLDDETVAFRRADATMVKLLDSSMLA